MIVERAIQSTMSWAYSEDIPGSRCGPEDGPWPRSYQILSESEVWRELRELAKPHSVLFDKARGFRADMVNFQPSPTTRTQDRYVVKVLEICGKKWTLTGVFDGHLGDVTVEHVAYHLPIIISEFLEAAFENDPEKELTPEYISELFSKSIMAFDDAIAHDVLDLFGGSIETLEKYSDREIREIINDQHLGGVNWTKARLCMYGTTALVALVDPEHVNLWVANLGDCQAVLITPDDDGTSDWKVEVITTSHNGDNDEELERIRKEHPGEEECILNRRVLGALAPTRCLGDIPFKQPPSFTRRVLYNLFPGFKNTGPWEEFLKRNLTPPYITSEPEIIYKKLRRSKLDLPAPPQLIFTPPSDDSIAKYVVMEGDGEEEADDELVGHSVRRPIFLVLASDGFVDLCNSSGGNHNNNGGTSEGGNGIEEGHVRIMESWARGMMEMWSFGEIGEGGGLRGGSGKSIDIRGSGNMALRLLRRCLGDDRSCVSKVLTLQMPEGSWIDDTAVVVQTL